MNPLTKHAEKRMQQRGIPLNIVEFLHFYGEPVKKPGKVLEYRIEKGLANSMIRDLKRMINRNAKARSKVILIDKDRKKNCYGLCTKKIGLVKAR